MRSPLPPATCIALAASLLLTGACRSSDSASASSEPWVTQPAHAPEPAAAAPAPTGPRKFGAALDPAPAIPLRSILDKPESFASQTVTVEAEVRRNCTRRGCWMELAESSDPGLQGCRVTFKDYGFFVPLDSAGSKARVAGTVEVHTVSAPEVSHMEGEGAHFAGKRPDGTASEVRMVATGVELWRERT